MRQTLGLDPGADASRNSRLRKLAAAVTVGFLLFGHLLTALRAPHIPAPVAEIVFRGLTFSLACAIICAVLYMFIERLDAARFRTLALMMPPLCLAAGMLTALSLIATHFLLTWEWHRDTRFDLFLSVTTYWTWFFLAWSGTVLSLKYGLSDPVSHAVGVEAPSYTTHLWANERGMRLRVPVEAIIRVEASGDYIVVHTPSRAHMIHDSLRSLAGRLDPAKFMRVHRGALVRLDAIETIECGMAGAVRLRLENGAWVKVSRRYRHMVLQLSRKPK